MKSCLRSALSKAADMCMQICISMVAQVGWGGDWAESLAVTLFRESQCIGCVPRLGRGRQLQAVRPIKQSLIMPVVRPE